MENMRLGRKTCDHFFVEACYGFKTQVPYWKHDVILSPVRRAFTSAWVRPANAALKRLVIYYFRNRLSLMYAAVEDGVEDDR